MMTLAGVLLAGGESRRMGRDKATLLLDGVPLWERQMGLLRALCPAELLVSAREAPPWLPADARFVADPLPARGPLGGLAAALGAMGATHLLALAIDMPAMTGEHLAALRGAASPGCGVLPWLGDHLEWLPAIYPAEAGTVAAGMLAGDDVSLKGFTRALEAAGKMKRHTIGSPDAKLYANCNSPAEWQRHAAHREPIHD
jgi:molybdopterin-guanine dinucleotide biosynthesis protein A